MKNWAVAGDPERPTRLRPKPAQRRVQVLQALAGMLEQLGGEPVTTAALAANLPVREATRYRHFASKAQMFDSISKSSVSLLLRLVLPMHLKMHWDKRQHCLRLRA